MSLLVVMAHHDPEGRIRAHTLRTIERLSAEASRFVLVSSSGVTLDEQESLPDSVEYERRIGPGHRFACYQHGLGFVGGAVFREFDTVLLVDSTFLGPTLSVEEIVNGPSTVGYEMVPLVSAASPRWHPQPYFLGFKKALLESAAFRRFWLDLDPSVDSGDSVSLAAELELALTGAGFRVGAYFRLTEADTAVGDARLERAELLQGRVPDPASAQGWDPTIALADEALLSGRLPVVPLRAVIEDPYILGGDRLLDLGESAFPGLFEGVRESLTGIPGLNRSAGVVRSAAELEAEGLAYGLRPTPL